jgi:hypothetical protein
LDEICSLFGIEWSAVHWTKLKDIFKKQLYTMVHSHLMLKLVFNENLGGIQGGILGGIQWVKMSFSLMLSEC